MWKLHTSYLKSGFHAKKNKSNQIFFVANFKLGCVNKYKLAHSAVKVVKVKLDFHTKMKDLVAGKVANYLLEAEFGENIFEPFFDPNSRHWEKSEEIFGYKLSWYIYFVLWNWYLPNIKLFPRHRFPEQLQEKIIDQITLSNWSREWRNTFGFY